MEDKFQGATDKGQNLDTIDLMSSDEGEVEDSTAIVEQYSLTTNEEHNTDCDVMKGSLIGMKGKTIDEMHELYCKHTRMMGFNVRKSTSRFSRDEIQIELAKLFVCSCAGFKKPCTDDYNSLNRESKKRKNSGTTRTNCRASMMVKMNDEVLYEVMAHNISHNHPLIRIEWNHLHRSERAITQEKGKVIVNMLSSGMTATDSFLYMVQDAGDVENLGHTKKDHLNCVNRWKMKIIEGGDAQTVIDMVQEQDTEEDDFFYKVKLDNDGRLTNIFWRDSMMKEDYEIYGDVVVFDTTYRTNKYNLICAPFIGINNHWRNVMFGCAFLADEKD